MVVDGCLLSFVKCGWLWFVVVYVSLLVVGCLLFVVWCFGVSRLMLLVVLCLVLGVRYSLFVVCCLLFDVVCGALFGIFVCRCCF